jgi:hypothetical protein
MLHLLSGITTYLDKKLQPCDTSLQLVKGVLMVGTKKDINPITGFVDLPIIDLKLQLRGISDHSEFDWDDKKALTKAIGLIALRSVRTTIPQEPS